MESTARRPGPQPAPAAGARSLAPRVPLSPLRLPAPPDGPDRHALRRLPPPPPPGPVARVTAASIGHAPLRSARVAVPVVPARPPLPLPHLRRNVCPHFYMTGSRGAIPVQAPHLLKALMRQESNVSRCQLRGGVHLDQGYVVDICLSSRFNQCVFYEDELTRR